MRSQKTKNRKKRQAKIKKEVDSGRRVSIPRKEIKRTNNEFLIGGLVVAISKPVERDGRVVRGLKLQCNHGARRESEPWVNVYDSLGVNLAARGRLWHGCFAGYVGRLEKPDARTRRTWELCATRLEHDGASNKRGFYYAANRIEVQGFVVESKSERVEGSNQMKCVFKLRCTRPGGRTDIVPLTGYDTPDVSLVEKVKEWSAEDELAIVAKAITYGSHAMNLVVTSFDGIAV